MLKNDKVEFVKNLAEELKDATCYVLVDYGGLAFSKQQELQKKLKKAGSQLRVVKNTLFTLAAKTAKSPKEITENAITGPSALVITKNDPIAPLQIIGKFAKENDIPKFKVGIVEGIFQNENSLSALSNLPGKEALYTQVVGTTGAPLYGLVATLQGNMQKLVFVLKTKVEQNSKLDTSN